MTNLANQEQNAGRRKPLRATRDPQDAPPPAQKGRKEPPVRKPAAKPTKAPASPSKERVVPVQVVNHVPAYFEAPQRSSMLTYDAGRPFWQKLPSVGLFFIKLTLWPLQMLRLALDTALTVMLLVVLVPLIAWSLGFVPDAIAIPFFETLGERSLALVRALGLEI